MKIRKKRKFEHTFSKWYIVNPGKPLHDEGLAYTGHCEEWREGTFNANREEYARTVEARVGYLHFASLYWEREPTQEIFDAFCEHAIEEHRKYVDWHFAKLAKDPGWVDLIPLVLPLGTCRMIADDPENTHWSLTPRQYETDYPYLEENPAG